jgi:hypothetical protein
VRLSSRAVFSPFADTALAGGVGCGEYRQGGEPADHRGDSQLESARGSTVLPKLSWRSRSRSMAGRTGWVPRCR